MTRTSDLRRRTHRLHNGVGFIYPIQNALGIRARSKRLIFQSLALVLFSTIFLVSCGGLVSSPPAVTVQVSPSSAQPFAATTVPFTATVQNSSSSAVNWQVNAVGGGNTTVGTIDSSGVYTAPNTVPTPPTVTITAVLQADSTKTGSASVTILSQSSISGPLALSPVLSSITLSQTLQLQVMTAGVSNSQVNWAVDGVANGNNAVGTISAGGLYTPPPTAGPHLILASLKANSAAIGTAQVEVTDFPGTLTWRNDNSRSGQNTRELALAPSTINSSIFGKLFSCPLDGFAYAQPLYVPNLAIPGSGTHNILFVATEMDSVFAFDADANPCVQLWQTSLIPAGEQAVPAPNLGITDGGITPFIGITGTPVIDVSSSTLYVVAETQGTTTNPPYFERLYALDLATGQRKIQPAGVQALSSSSIGPTFSPLLANQRAALLLDNSTVYVAFGSHNGEGNYHGWLMSYNAATLQPIAVFDVTPGGMQGGIWQSGGGPSADSNHNVYVATGGGTFDVNRGGSDYGDSFMRLATGGAISVADYFTPCDQATLSGSGNDLGSSPPVLLPDAAGSASEPHLMMGGAKNGSLYVLNRDNLGRFNSSCPDAANRVQVMPIGNGPILSTPLFWNNTIYIAAGNGALEAFPIPAGILSPTPLSAQSTENLGPQGATPVLSSNGTNNALVWLIDSSGAFSSPNTPSILRAFDASNLSNEVYNSAMVPSRDTAGLAVKFSVPTIANGKVYIGTQSEIDVYGLLY
jgi:hypothetical protein